MNTQNFWDFVNNMDNPGRAKGAGANPGPPPMDWTNYAGPWGFPFGNPLPHRGRPGPPPPMPATMPSVPPVAPHTDLSRPGTPPTPPESVPEPHWGRSPSPRRRHRSTSPPHRRHRSISPPPPPHRNRSISSDRAHPPPPGPHGPRGHRHGGPRRGRHGRGDFPPWGRAFNAHGPPAAGIFGDIPYYASQIPNFISGMMGPDLSGPGMPPTNTFTPETDVFSNSEAYIIHASIPGAKKTDIDVSYNATSHAVKLSGVIQRPDEVDERMMTTMRESGRKIGLFERIVILDVAYQIDADGIKAKLEDGVLRVEVPKLRDHEWIDVKKVVVQ